MFRESMEPLLRPTQVAEMEDEAKRLQDSLSAPPHIRSQIQDPGHAQRQLRRLKAQLEKQAPKAYEAAEKDAAVRRERELREVILQGMPTQREMRRNLAGAVDKHIAWADRTKLAVAEWKNIRLRLHRGGDLDSVPRAARDVANVETLRPTDAGHELNMHNEQIAGRDYHFGGSGSVILSADDLAILRSHEPELFRQVALMTAEQREQVKEMCAVLRGDQSVTQRAPMPSKAAHNQPKPRQPEPAEKPERKVSEYTLLQRRAKALGINPFGVPKDKLRAEVEAAEQSEAA